MSSVLLKIWVKIAVIFGITCSILLFLVIYILNSILEIQKNQNDYVNDLKDSIVQLNEFFDDSEIDICEY